MYTVFIVPQNADDRDALEVSVESVASGQSYVVADQPVRRTEPRVKPSIRFLVNGAKHKALNGLGAEDFINAQLENCLEPLNKPNAAINQRTLLAGDRHGETVALAEQPTGSGLVIQSAIDFTGCLDQAPLAYLFANLLDYQFGYAAEEISKTAALVGASWKQQLDVLEVLYSDWKDGEDFDTVIVDAADAGVREVLQSNKAAFADFVTAGGNFLVLDVVDESLEVLSEITGKPLELTEPFLGETQHCVKAAITWTRKDTPTEMVEYYDSIVIPAPFEWNYDPLLSGIANADLDWNSATMLDHGVSIQGMDPVFASPDYTILISNWKIDWSRPTFGGEYTHLARDERRYNWFVNRDPALLKINRGEGRVLLSTLKFKENAGHSTALFTQLLTNLKVSLGDANQFAADASVFDLVDQQLQQQRFAENYYATPAVRNTDVYDNVFVQESSKKPEILLIGDSYSAAYFDRTAELLTNYGATHQLTYEGSTQDCLQLLEDKGSEWLAQYDVIYVAGGWGDFTAPDESTYTQSIEQLIALLAKTSSKAYWGTQLPLPTRQGTFTDQVIPFRSLATQQMNASDVYVVDVGSFAEKEFSTYLAGDQLALGDDEIEAVAKQVNAAIQFFGE